MKDRLPKFKAIASSQSVIRFEVIKKYIAQIERIAGDDNDEKKQQDHLFPSPPRVQNREKKNAVDDPRHHDHHHHQKIHQTYQFGSSQAVEQRPPTYPRLR
jgi:hypothetical protein